MSWIAEDLVPALRDIPSTCVVDIGIYITGSRKEEGDPLEAVQTLSQSEPVTPDIEKHPQVRSGSLSIKSADALAGLVGIPGVSVRFCRPDVKEILETEIKNADGDISVNGQLSRFRLWSIFLVLRPCFVASLWRPRDEQRCQEGIKPCPILGHTEGCPQREPPCRNLWRCGAFCLPLN